MPKREWPWWWHWDLVYSSHLLKRMVDRQFSDLDLRRMLDRATHLREDVVDGRCVVETRHLGHPWEIIAEPDFEAEFLLIVTAYPVD